MEQDSKGAKKCIVSPYYLIGKASLLIQAKLLCKDLVVWSPSQCVPGSAADRFLLPKPWPAGNISSCSGLATQEFSSHIFLSHSASFPLDPSHSQAGAHISSSLSQLRAVGCPTPATWGCDTPMPRRPQAQGRRTQNKQAPTSSGQHKPQQLPEPCATGSLCMAFYW